jgi:hypothetical protein
MLVTQYAAADPDSFFQADWALSFLPSAVTTMIRMPITTLLVQDRSR